MSRKPAALLFLLSCSSLLFSACSSADRSMPGDSAGADAPSATVPATPTPPPLDAGESMLPVAGGNVWVRIRGFGPGAPLIVVPGAPGTGSAALKPFEALGQERVVARFDLLGTGKSDTLPDGTVIDIAREVRELEQLRRELKLDFWSVLGHSYGAAIVAAYARQYPGRVISVVLVNPLLPGTPDDGTHTNANTPVFADSSIAVQYAADLDTLRLSRGAAIGDALRLDANDSASRVFVVDSVAAMMRRARIPVLIIAGGKDASGVASARTLKAKLPQATLSVYPDAGLYLPWEATDKMLDEVRAFLGKHEKIR